MKSPSDLEVMKPLRALREVGAAVFAELGGGENFLRDERSQFSVASIEELKP